MAIAASETRYRFTFGPWNIHEGADPFGPAVREPVALSRKLKTYKELGFDGVQFHDDDAVPDVDGKSAVQIEQESRRIKQVLDDNGLVVEIVAPRLWEDPRGIDGGYTSNDPKARQWAIERTLRCMDIARGPQLQPARALARPRGDLHPRVQERAGGP